MIDGLELKGSAKCQRVASGACQFRSMATITPTMTSAGTTIGGTNQSRIGFPSKYLQGTNKPCPSGVADGRFRVRIFEYAVTVRFFAIDVEKYLSKAF